MLISRRRPLIFAASAVVTIACIDRPASSPISAAPAGPPVRPFTPYAKTTLNPYTDRFLTMWNEIHDPKNGYFSANGIPYHARETLIVEAPDYGHETTSETYSYWLWLESIYGRVTNDWTHLDEAWTNLEAYTIPGAADQPTTSGYDASKPASYAPELDDPREYPPPFADIPLGADPLVLQNRLTPCQNDMCILKHCSILAKDIDDSRRTKVPG